MPSSVPQAITHICNKILQKDPKTFLDIGVGHGKWGFLVREYTDVWKSIMNPKYNNTIIHGIEVYPDYIGKIQKLVYDKIFIGEANKIINTLPIKVYDMIIMADTIEHMSKEIGAELLDKIYKKCKCAFITTPKNVIITGKSMNYNPYETHICEWSISELEKYGDVRDLGGNVLLLQMEK
jgi:hypothetical protein